MAIVKRRYLQEVEELRQQLSNLVLVIDRNRIDHLSKRILRELSYVLEQERAHSQAKLAD